MDRSNPIHLCVYRTENSVRPTYRGDGQGRCTYILDNNGGLRKDKEMWGMGRRPGWYVGTKQL